MSHDPPRGRRLARVSLLSVWAAGAVAACGKAGAPEQASTPRAQESPGARCVREARTPREPRADAPERIVVSHVLVRHAELASPVGATRTPEQACLRALRARAALEAGREWEEVVSEFSDAPGAEMGALGRVSRDELSPSFADAAFALDVNEMSYVVETDRGFHVIVRTE